MIRILIVEDEMPIADLLDMSLTAAGYSCDCLDNGAAAADAVESRRYDLILLDVMLPGIDGFELMEYLAPLEIPVIFITARSTVKDRIKGLKLGADDYIVKPFSLTELAAFSKTAVCSGVGPGSCEISCPTIPARLLIICSFKTCCACAGSPWL